MVGLESGLTEEIQSATDMVESSMVPPRCTGLRVVCSATRSHTRAGLNVHTQSAEAGLRLRAVHYSRAGRVETVPGDAGGSGPW